ncbi:MAG: class I SAM-dependent methyltransferase [Anaerolineales bacterium]
MGEWLAWNLNKRFARLDMHRDLIDAKSDIEANQQWACEEARRVFPAFRPYRDLAGQHILDIGCGLGGKLPFYINELGARIVTAVDVDLNSTHIARRHIASQHFVKDRKRAIGLATADAATLPFPDDCFDAVVSINVFEHIMDLEASLGECHRVLKMDGLAFIYLPPYYSPWGPHIESWIRFPWPHLLFSEKTLMRVAAREDAMSHLNERFVQAARIDWSANANQIPDVNHVTLRRFRQTVRRAGFHITQLELLPFGNDYLRTGSFSSQLASRVLKAATRIPLLQEVIVTKMAYVLQKTA